MWNIAVAICAIIGAILGIYNTFFQNKTKVILTIQKILKWDSSWPSGFECIPVKCINLSNVPIRIEEFGVFDPDHPKLILRGRLFGIFSGGNKYRLGFHFPSENLPRELQPRTSMSAHIARTTIEINRFSSTPGMLFYITTEDGCTFFDKVTRPVDLANLINDINAARTTAKS